MAADMNKMLKITLAALGLVLALLLAAAAWLAFAFDPNAWKPWLAERVQQATGRTLAIPGELRLTLFPQVGVQTGAVSLSQPGGKEPFASLASARVSLALLPLFRRQAVVDRIEIEGLKAQVTRFPDGRTSIDDLLGGAAPPPAAGAPAQPLQFDIAGIVLNNAELAFDDRLAGRRIGLAQAALQTGRITPGQPGEARFEGRLTSSAPQVDARLALKGRFLMRPAERRYVFEGLEAQADGRLAALADASLRVSGKADVALAPLRLDLAGLQLTLKGRPAGGTLEASLAVPQLQLGEAEVRGQKISARATLQQGARRTEADLTLADFTGRTPKFTIPALQAGFSVQDGALKLGGKVSGSAAADLDAERVDLKLAGTLDDSRLAATLGLAGFAKPALRFDIDVDRVDADRYRPPPAPATAASAPEAPLDFGALAALNASGSLKVGELKAAGLALQRLRVDLKAAGGRVALAPLAAELYGGRTSGSVVLQAASPPRIAVAQTLTGVDIAPLLKDLAGRDTLEGRGDVTLDVTTQGRTVTAMKKALAGSATLALRDGAVKGFNIAQAIRRAKTQLGLAGASAQGTGSVAEKTDFSELGGSFRIAGGVARTEDLAAKSPLLRVGAVGDVDLGESRLDVTVRATVVPTLQGQGGPELQALRGQTVPVRLFGPFTAIDYRVDLAGMAEAAAREKLEQKKDVLEQKARDKLGEKLKGIFR